MISCQHEPRFYSGGYQWCPKCGVFKKDSETGWNLPSQFRALLAERDALRVRNKELIAELNAHRQKIRELQSILNATLSEGERG